MNRVRQFCFCATVFAGLAMASTNGFADTGFRGGYYQGIPGTGARFNSFTGAVHLPGQSVFKNSGRYDHIGNGYYRNQNTGNVYNPYTRSYTRGKYMSFRPGQYQNLGNGNRYNSTTGAFHVPGQAVIKPSGVYHHIGNGYYRNPMTGNTYNPYTRAYKY